MQRILSVLKPFLQRIYIGFRQRDFRWEATPDTIQAIWPVVITLGLGFAPVPFRTVLHKQTRNRQNTAGILNIGRRNYTELGFHDGKDIVPLSTMLPVLHVYKSKLAIYSQYVHPYMKLITIGFCLIFILSHFWHKLCRMKVNKYL